MSTQHLPFPQESLPMVVHEEEGMSKTGNAHTTLPPLVLRPTRVPCKCECNRCGALSSIVDNLCLKCRDKEAEQPAEALNKLCL